ncbi:MAG: hypothetical protein JWN14_794 [Chthonomonadales bacterium]|nr:hypothetical protein [Chthonomonadales bacterium]
MPRVSAGVPNKAKTPFDVEGLTDRQSEILRLYFIEGMKQFRIAQELRLHPKTVQRDIAAALDILRTSEEEMRGDIDHQSGRVRMDITIAYATDEIVSRPDSTLITVSKILTIPGFRRAYYSPDSSPDRIKAIHAQIDGVQGKKGKRARKQAA